MIIGGGALGVQFATDIKELHPRKKVTLIHSRQRLLPVFEQEIHDAALKRLHDLKIEVILGDRVVLDHKVPLEGQHQLVTESGRHIDSDLRLLCTGQKPNTWLCVSVRDLGLILIFLDRLKKLSPSLLTEHGFVHVDRTMQVADPRSNNVFAIGDCADAFGSIKAGHTGR